MTENGGLPTHWAVVLSVLRRAHVPLSDIPLASTPSFSTQKCSTSLRRGSQPWHLAHSLLPASRHPLDYDVLQYQATTDPNGFIFATMINGAASTTVFISRTERPRRLSFGRHTTVSRDFLLNEGSEPYFTYTFVNPFSSKTYRFTTQSPTLLVVSCRLQPKHTEISPREMHRCCLRLAGFRS